MSLHRAWLLLLAAFVLLAAHSLWFGDWIADDAAISFTYAHNLAQYGELTLFPGGERTEGFSSPLWVAIIAVFAKLGLFHPVVVPKILGMLLQGLSLVLVTALARHLVPTGARWVSYLPALFLALCTSFVVWGVSGLESPLLTALVLFSFLKMLRDEERGTGGWGLGLLFFLIAITRPEGILYGGVIWLVLAGRCLAAWRSDTGSPRAHCLYLLRFSCTLGAPVLAIVLGRWFYFHDVAPNSYYARIGQTMMAQSLAETLDQGWSYVRSGIRAQSWNLLVPFTVLSLTCLRRFEIRVLWSLVLASVVLPVCAGGDWMMEYRLLGPLYPLYLLAAMVGWTALSVHVRTESLRGFHTLAAILALCVMVVGMAQGWQRSRAAKEQPTLAMKTTEDEARALRAYADGLGLDHATAMIPDAGGSSFFGRQNNLEILDLGGLADRFVSRLGLGEHIWEYVLDIRRPHFLSVRDGWSAALDIQRSSRFREFYKPIWEDRGDYFSAAEYEDRDYLKSGSYVRRDLVTVPADSVPQATPGPQVGSVRFRGWDHPQVTPRGALRVTTYWEVMKRQPFPTFQVNCETPDGRNRGSRETELAGGCYTRRFARVGDIVPTTVVLDSVPEPGIGQPLKLAVVVKKGEKKVSIPLDTVTARPAPGFDAAQFLRRSRELIAQGELETCLGEILDRRDQSIPGLDADLRQIQRDLARAFFARAQEQERSPEFMSLVPRIWSDTWNAWQAWKGFSPALIRSIDYWPLRQFMGGSVGSIPTRALRISWSESTTLYDVYRGLVSSVFPFHDLRLAEIRNRIPQAPLPAAREKLVYLQGWKEPEDWGRWSIVETAHVYVRNPGTARLRLRASTWPGMRELQWVTAYFEGEYLGSKWVQEPHGEMNDHEFYLPAEPAHGVVSLRVRHLFPPPFPSGNSRALRVESIEVVKPSADE